MTDTEWQSVWQVLCGLWPKLGASATHEEELSYRRCCLNAREGEAIRALRTLKDTSIKFLQPAMLAAQIRRGRTDTRPDAVRYAERRAAMEAQARENHREWSEIDAALAEVPADELEQHKATLLHHDWRLGWLRDKPITDRGWRAHLYFRIFRDRLGPTDPPVDPVPDRGAVPAGDLAGAYGGVL